MRVIHLIYIHGFRGDDTTFQAFPTDLQQYLSSHIPSGLNVQFKTSLYPTYKSIKPISHATRNFLEWLSTQPPDPVILLCHSMGGLLGAEAAVSAKSHRILGFISFDVPFLGMHPHVVVSGIASLFPKDDDKPKESQVNLDPAVKIVDKNVTDDWDNFKKQIDAPARSQSSLTSHLSTSTTPPRMASPHLSVSPYTPPSRSPSPETPFMDKALSIISDHANDPLVRWFKKHSNEPVTASKRWIIEHFQFGICMFDPAGLQERYSKLVKWSGLWVNYWTQTVPKTKHDHVTTEQQSEQMADNDLALIENGIAGDSLTKEERKIKQKEHKKQLKQLEKQSKTKSGRHFIVLPTGLGQVLGGSDKWEKVLIGGVEDEVAAHCGLFIRTQNLDYDGFTNRVGNKVYDWCRRL